MNVKRYQCHSLPHGPGPFRLDTFDKNLFSNFPSAKLLIVDTVYIYIIIYTCHMLFLAEMCSHSHMSNPSKKHGSCTLHPHLVIEKVFWKMSFFHNDLFNKPVQMCMVACYTQYDVWYK